jgi:hypothetical protein
MNIASKRARRAHQASQPTFAELFTPKLVTVLREGYRLSNFREDVQAGLTVAIVALPLSMAIAIGSGVTPDRGLYTAIVGGFLVSALGGSRFQIGGPAGAFIVLVGLTAARHGIDGVVLATMMAGMVLVLAGYLRLGTYIKFIPYPVTVGFTAGIAVSSSPVSSRICSASRLPARSRANSFRNSRPSPAHLTRSISRPLRSPRPRLASSLRSRDCARCGPASCSR